MPPPEGYLITWTTYATRLHGHAGGSTDHARDGHGPTRLKPDPRLLARRARVMREPAFHLGPEAREIVGRAIRAVATHNRWALLALAVRSNHVHLLIRAHQPPERVMTACKSWATRALREAGAIEDRAKVWTRHGSTRWINDKDDLSRAFEYVTEWQEGGLAAARYGARPGAMRSDKPRP